MKIFATVRLQALLLLPLLAQQPPAGPPPGPGGPMHREERKIREQFDKNSDGYLDAEERAAAREFLKENPAPRWGSGPGGRRGPGGPGGFGPRQNQDPPTAGPQVAKEDAKPVPGNDFYAGDTLRTLFLDFESEDWEAELEAFHNTDVEVPATLTVDGRTYPGVGASFRGASSYMMVPSGRKRSLNLTVDFSNRFQRVYGYKTLNLLNCNGDASLMSAALYSRIARKYIPAPKVNFVKVVVNGEYRGVFANQQQFNKEFIQENFRTTKGARWKVPGSPNGRGGLNYIGEDPAAYERIYVMKSGDDSDRAALIRLCKTLSETPLEDLEAALEPQLDIESTLWFLALDVALINSDGYWTRASDYTIYRDSEGRFHLVPHDMNEGFRGAGGPWGGGDGVKLDPLVGKDDAAKPLRSRLLAVPSLRERYLEKVRTIATDDLDWKNLGPVVASWRELIGPSVAEETRGLASFEQFQRATADEPAAEGGEGGGFGRGAIPLRAFADQRRAYLLSVLEKNDGDPAEGER